MGFSMHFLCLFFILLCCCCILTSSVLISSSFGSFHKLPDSTFDRTSSRVTNVRRGTSPCNCWTKCLVKPKCRGVAYDPLDEKCIFTDLTLSEAQEISLFGPSEDSVVFYKLDSSQHNGNTDDPTPAAVASTPAAATSAAAVTTTEAVAATTPAPPSGGDSFLGSDGHTYVFYKDDKKSWTDALNWCKSFPGYRLPVFRKEDQPAVASHISDNYADFWFDLKKDAGGEVSSDGVRFLGSGGVANTLRIDGGSGDKLCFLMKKDLIQDEDCSADKEFACQSVGTT